MKILNTYFLLAEFLCVLGAAEGANPAAATIRNPPSAPTVTSATTSQKKTRPAGGGFTPGPSPKVVMPTPPPALKAPTFFPFMGSAPQPRSAISVPPRINPQTFVPKTGVTIQRAEAPSSVLRGQDNAQIYLELADELRELEALIENIKALRKASETAQSAFSDIHLRQRRLLANHAISEEEYERSRFQKDLATALTPLYSVLIDSYQSRLSAKELQAAALKNGTAVNVDDLYALYSAEWDAQCKAAKLALKASFAPYQLNSHAVKLVTRLGNATTYFEILLRQKDFAIAQADLAAREELESTCHKGLPTLKQIKEIISGETKLGNHPKLAINAAQYYLGLVNDIRDLDSLIENTKALHTGANASTLAFGKIFTRQLRIYRQNALSAEGLEHSRAEANLAAALKGVYSEQTEMYKAKLELRVMQASAIKGSPLPLKGVYDLYIKRWNSECLAVNKLVQASESQLDLSDYIYRLNRQIPTSVYERLLSRKNMEIARFDLDGKRAIQAECEIGIPTWGEISGMVETPTVNGDDSAHAYLALIDDIRDSSTRIQEARALELGYSSSAKTFGQIYIQQQKVRLQRAISPEELESSKADRDLPIAFAAMYKKEGEAFGARLKRKKWQIAALKTGHLPVETLYEIFANEWDAQCEAAKFATQAARAQVQLNDFVMGVTRRLGSAATHYERLERWKDQVAARANLSAKINIETNCRRRLPTLKEINDVAAR